MQLADLPLSSKVSIAIVPDLHRWTWRARHALTRSGKRGVTLHEAFSRVPHI
jgi:hypothetical protein